MFRWVQGMVGQKMGIIKTLKLVMKTKSFAVIACSLPV